MSDTSTWRVRPHDPVRQLADNLWVADGSIHMPTGELPRRMTIARMADGRLAIFSAIALSELEMSRVEALGEPAFLVVPNPFHREDAPGWKARYPDLRVVTPRGAVSAVESVLPVDHHDDVFGDPSVRFLTVPGTGEIESALVIASADGTTLVLNDLIGNIHDARGFMGLVLRGMGFAGRQPQIPRVFAARAIKDKAAVADQFRQWAALPDLRRIIVSHGAIIETTAPDVLRRLAERLR